ncbi:glycosyltransferase [Roseibium aggregatum]|uniref:Glycosyltransferase n=1 Tax=Roseibium aggregatum TaxID=187304 RepID=A0A926P4D6_9HYPH|nr:glycosyltransferase [Roseibium aggregatum]MBD1549648.1 glycosyltransferase [Roseibium aggregatum]
MGTTIKWCMTGDDPQIIIRFPLFRENFLVLELTSLDGPIEPTIYVPRLGRYDERHARRLPEAENFLIVAPVGAIGNVCKLRVDPSTAPGTITTRLTTHRRYEDVQKAIDTFNALMSSKHLACLESFPKITLPLKSLFSFRKKKSIRDRLSIIYDLAAREGTAANRIAPEEIWLSLVTPIYNTPARYLDDLYRSFLKQDMPGCELILSDDGSSSLETHDWLRRHQGLDRLKIVQNPANDGIAQATNAGLRAASGGWIGFIDHDDLIAPNALKVIHNAITAHRDVEFIYTDEVIVDDTLEPITIMSKPAYDPVLLSGVNYINHLSLYRRELLESLSFLRKGFDGSQDYDLLLRYTKNLRDHEVLHIPYPAYWWRHTKGSYSQKYLEKATYNARSSLKEAYGPRDNDVQVEKALHNDLHRVSFDLADEDQPFISIIIPNKNSHSLISQILSDIYTKTNYKNFEVIVVDNGSDSQDVLGLYEHYAKKHDNFCADIVLENFNFSRSINRGFRLSSGTHFLLLNNDIEVLDPDWLKELVSCLNYPNVGIVGAKLLFPNDTLQHAGVIIGASDLAGHYYYRQDANFGGPMNRLKVRNSVVCVTGAVMLISGDCKNTVGELDEANFAIAYNDVDYCIRAHRSGFRSVWTPFACLRHHESISRGSDKLPQNLVRFQKEKNNLREIHGTPHFMDPTISPYDPIYCSQKTAFDGTRLPSPRHWFHPPSPDERGTLASESTHPAPNAPNHT